MIWYNPLMGNSCARRDASQSPAAERTASPIVLCFVIFTPVRRSCPLTGRSCCTGPLRTGAVPRVPDPPGLADAATVCLYDNCQTVNVKTTAHNGSNINGSKELYQ